MYINGGGGGIGYIRKLVQLHVSMIYLVFTLELAILTSMSLASISCFHSDNTCPSEPQMPEAVTRMVSATSPETWKLVHNSSKETATSATPASANIATSTSEALASGERSGKPADGIESFETIE